MFSHQCYDKTDAEWLREIERPLPAVRGDKYYPRSAEDLAAAPPQPLTFRGAEGFVPFQQPTHEVEIAIVVQELLGEDNGLAALSRDQLLSYAKEQYHTNRKLTHQLEEQTKMIAPTFVQRDELLTENDNMALKLKRLERQHSRVKAKNNVKEGEAKAKEIVRLNSLKVAKIKARNNAAAAKAKSAPKAKAKAKGKAKAEAKPKAK